VNVWTMLKRLNSKTDDWSRRTLGRMITNIDSPKKGPVRKHISVRDLVRRGLQSGENSDEHEN
jgi:hypothetical protein